jgi:hypothetical protein
MANFQTKFAFMQIHAPPPPPRFSVLLFLLSIYSFTKLSLCSFLNFFLDSRFVFLLSPPPLRSDYYLSQLDEKKPEIVKLNIRVTGL